MQKRRVPIWIWAVGYILLVMVLLIIFRQLGWLTEQSKRWGWGLVFMAAIGLGGALTFVYGIVGLLGAAPADERKEAWRCVWSGALLALAFGAGLFKWWR